MIQKLLVTAILVLLLQTSANANCLSYNAPVTLTGTIAIQTFPGPPNYENIKNGDKPDSCWIMHLREPICVIAAQDDELNETEKNVSEIELVFMSKEPQPKPGSIKIQGTLFHAITGHHHTKVLMEVKTIN